jgi:hypothetical protein
MRLVGSCCRVKELQKRKSERLKLTARHKEKFSGAGN